MEMIKVKNDLKVFEDNQIVIYRLETDYVITSKTKIDVQKLESDLETLLRVHLY